MNETGKEGMKLNQRRKKRESTMASSKTIAARKGSDLPVPDVKFRSIDKGTINADLIHIPEQPKGKKPSNKTLKPQLNKFLSFGPGLDNPDDLPIKDNISEIDNFSSNFQVAQEFRSSNQMKSNLLKGAAIAKIINSRNSQRKRLLLRAFRSFQTLLLSSFPNVIIYARTETEKDLSFEKDIEEAKKNIISTAIERSARYSRRKLLGMFHQWRFYSKFARSIDPDLYNSRQTFGVPTMDIDLQQIDPNMGVPIFPKLKKLKELSAGFAMIKKLQSRRLWKGWHAVLEEASTQAALCSYNNDLAQYRSLHKLFSEKYNTLEKIRKYFIRWREHSIKINECVEIARLKLSVFTRIFKKFIVLEKYRKFNKWKEACSSLPREESKKQFSECKGEFNLSQENSEEEESKFEPNPSEMMSENVVDEEETGIMKPNVSGHAYIKVYEKYIQSASAQIYQLLKGKSRSKDLSYQIKKVCVSMALEVLNSYTLQQSSY